MLEMVVLGSGSGGNSVLFRAGDDALLVDAGLNSKQMRQRLEKTGTPLKNIRAILLTHEHGDHTSGLRLLCRDAGIPVYCNPLTAEAIRFQSPDWKISWKLFATGTSFSIGEMEIHSFSVPHDAADPVGFVVAFRSKRIGIVTDAGSVTRSLERHLAGTSAVFLESNYDEQLLEQDARRPWSTKQRILSRHGHLSNRDAAELAAGIFHSGLHTLVLGHLSENCNRADIAESTFREVFSERSLPLPRIVCATQQAPTMPVVA
jgi:phosphoribosyl 1,2-cyclic phosphodiesterase